MAILYCVVFGRQTPGELLELLDGYLHQDPRLNFTVAFARSAVHAGPFLACEFMHAEKNKTWEVQIPIGTVLSIITFEEDKPPFGFGRAMIQPLPPKP